MALEAMVATKQPQRSLRAFYLNSVTYVTMLFRPLIASSDSPEVKKSKIRKVNVMLYDSIPV